MNESGSDYTALNSVAAVRVALARSSIGVIYVNDVFLIGAAAATATIPCAAHTCAAVSISVSVERHQHHRS